jgi:acetyltransferase-like isoleucine patch superfamily enzyme
MSGESSGRRLIKLAVFAVCFALVAPLVALAWLEKHIWAGEALFNLFAQFLALWPGPPGSHLRGAYYFGTLERCSWETHVGFGSIFMHRGGALGTRASIGTYCVLGNAHIGAGVMMGSRVSIPSGKRQHIDEEGRLTSSSTFDTVMVGARTWVGEGAIIIGNIGSDCIVAAGAVVTKAMPAGVLIGGNPARIIRVRAAGCAAASEVGQ